MGGVATCGQTTAEQAAQVGVRGKPPAFPQRAAVALNRMFTWASLNLFCHRSPEAPPVYVKC